MNQERLMKVLVSPIVSEKSTMVAEKNEQVAFRVLQDATKPEIKVEICSQCHPFYTGKQKIMDTEGRVEKFIKRYGLQDQYKDEQ